MSEETGPLGPYDELLSAELEAARQAGKEQAALLLMVAQLTKTAPLRVQEARRIVEEYLARCHPELVQRTEERRLRIQKGFGWFMLALAVLQTALLFGTTDLSTLSFAVPICFWIIAGTQLADGYWVKGEPRKYRILWAVAGVLFLGLGAWAFIGSAGWERAFGFLWVAVAVMYFAIALRKKWP